MEVLDRTHAEPFIDELDALRTEARQGGDLAEFARQLMFQGLEKIELSRRDDRRDLAGEVLADPGEFTQVFARLEQSADALRLSLDDARRPPIGAGAERIVALDFQKFGRLVEHCRDFGIVDRHASGSRLA
jgi:hypothetical protein